MLVASAGIAATGTFAWYTATNATITPAAATATVTTSNGASSLGEFTVTAVVTNSPASPKLTDGSGNTYVWDSSASENRQITDAGTGMVEVALKLTISYSGALSDQGDISDAWDASVGSKKAKIVCTDNTASSTSLSSAQKTRYAAIGTAADTNPYGLKFASTNSDYDNEGEQTIEVKNNAGITGLTFVAGSVDVTVSSVYMGVWGVDGFEQLSTDTYEAKFTPSIAA